MPVIWRAVGLALSVGLIAISLGVSTAHGNTFGHRHLIVNQCCGGAGLYGTRASIYTPVQASDLTFPTTNCYLARSEGQIAASGLLIQAGWLRCATGASLDGTCSLSNNLVNFVERLTPSTGYQCFPQGAVGYNTNHLYSVLRVNNAWYAYIDGVQDGHSIAMGGAQLILEGAEWTGGCESFHGYADYALSGTAWQRYTSDATWFTVQSSNINLDCGWSTSGAPPGTFRFAH